MRTSTTRSVCWLLAACLLLAIGFLLLEIAIIAPGMEERWDWSAPEWALARQLHRRIAVDVMLPHVLATGATCLLAERLVPAFWSSPARASLAVPVVACAWFPLVSNRLFEIWDPLTPLNYMTTLALMSGAASLALLLPRRLLRRRRSGKFPASVYVYL
jgi:hypothetical protein